jgi:hypothetical protein
MRTAGMTTLITGRVGQNGVHRLLGRDQWGSMMKTEHSLGRVPCISRFRVITWSQKGLEERGCLPRRGVDPGLRDGRQR